MKQVNLDELENALIKLYLDVKIKKQDEVIQINIIKHRLIMK
jgi:hypothetical protein